jgi:hypothetical protein
MKTSIIYNTYEVTFSENKKYNSTTRTVSVKATGEEHAERLVHEQFGSMKNLFTPSKKVDVTKVKLVDNPN